MKFAKALGSQLITSTLYVLAIPAIPATAYLLQKTLAG